MRNPDKTKTDKLQAKLDRLKVNKLDSDARVEGAFKDLEKRARKWRLMYWNYLEAEGKTEADYPELTKGLASWTEPSELTLAEYDICHKEYQDWVNTFAPMVEEKYWAEDDFALTKHPKGKTFNDVRAEKVAELEKR
uniref:Uncharacterized protein n=1 Tax=viral metagenome TaxID=1070528 RepID=A0A6M3J852_9ZZZZ